MSQKYLKVFIKTIVENLFSKLGYVINKKGMEASRLPIELEPDEVNLILNILKEKVSMASIERLSATLLAAKYISVNNISGAYIECGVWRGGNSIIASYVFEKYNDQRKCYLFDTYSGMTKPTQDDYSIATMVAASEKYNENIGDGVNNWCLASLEDVKSNFRKYSISTRNIEFIKGDVMNTIDSHPIDNIAFLRLDTDWYESTKKELESFYSKINRGGVLMIDDYGHWAGSKKAVDEFFDKLGYRPLMHTIDYTGRTVLKI